MKPIKFKETNKILQKPDNMIDEDCQSLYVYTDEKQCISCWKLSLWERLKLIFTGKLWVRVHSGSTQPPIVLDLNNPF